jgi:DNA-binding transcriptional regulator YdaS (Cro superfamily)
MKLADWLAIPNPDGSKKRRNAFAAAIEVTPIMVTQYCEGTAWPGRDKMAAIARETAGAVTANDFVDMQQGAA